MNYRFNGKLLITGEYVVLDGAKALAFPTKFGQKMSIFALNSSNKKIIWNAYNYQSRLWFFCLIDLNKVIVLESSNKSFSHRLLHIFKVILELNPNFYNELISDYQIDTFLEFPNNWGLGSSSTLIKILSKFTKVNPYQLLEKTFGGSGYDLACAENNSPIFFTKLKYKRVIEQIKFNPVFSNRIYFVHLNHKQNSRVEISHYQKVLKNKLLINKISDISEKITTTTSIKEFEYCINDHENLLSVHLKKRKIQNIYFNDYHGGVIKSLGAWGGDFIMVTSKENPKEYFKKKGFNVIITFEDMVLNNV